MRGKLIFGAGVGIGYVLGTRAGRERFDRITGQAKRFWESNTVQEAAAVMQTQAERLYDGGKKMMSDQMHQMREHRHDNDDQQHHTKAFRKGRFPERNRGRTEWGAPAGAPANPPTGVAPNPANSMTTPY
ncbi:MAG TPA: hypothetical protein VH561_17800 [Micromonosporaceae bacterium]|jgi:hypothetical protein